MNLWQPDL